MNKTHNVQWDKMKNKGSFKLNNTAQLNGEGLFWLDTNKLDEKDGKVVENPETVLNLNWKTEQEWAKYYKNIEENANKKKRVHLLALGDVGGTVLMNLKMLGGDCIKSIGIFDMNENVCKRYEMELNQAMYPFFENELPEIEIIKEENLFDCDVFVFCASKGIPPVGAEVSDVRMVQFEANKGLVSIYGKKARDCNFGGLFVVVSDPVDPLCKAVFLSSNQDENGNFDGKGLMPEQVQGYGLGVMNARACYYAKKDDKFKSFLTEGRAYGPHGGDLVIANSIENYDDELSKELTDLAVTSNLKTRDLGFKPYIAPAISSATINILLTLRGEWHYSSNFIDGVYVGCKNRSTKYGIEFENLPLDEKLYKRIENAFNNLEEII